MIQQTMFDHLAPEYEVPQQSDPDITVERPPGWTLIVGKRGPKGWHRIKAEGPNGARYTYCGLVGRSLTESEPRIVLCDDCAAV